MRGHTPSFLTRKGIFANKKNKTAYFFFTRLLKDAFGLHEGSYVVFTWKIVSLIFQCIAIDLAATNPKIQHKVFLQ